MTTPSNIPEKSSFTDSINPVIIANWLIENERNPVYGHEVAELRHAYELIGIITNNIGSTPYTSISEVFENELTLAEFREYQVLEFQEFTVENIQRKVFLEVIYAKELDRTRAKRYAELCSKEFNKNLNNVETDELQNFKDELQKAWNVARNDTISIGTRIGLTAEVAKGILNSSMMGRNAIIKAKKGDNNEPQK